MVEENKPDFVNNALAYVNDEGDEKKLILTPEYVDWVELYFGDNPKFRHNAKASALEAYKCSPSTAGLIGHKNLVKTRQIHGVIAADLGLTFKQYISEYIAKARDGSFEDFEKMGQTLGYIEKEKKAGQPGGTVVPIQINNNLNDKSKEYGI